MLTGTMLSILRVEYEKSVSKNFDEKCSQLEATTVYTKVPDLSEKGSCKIFIAGAPQRVTHCNCGYLMRTTPPYTSIDKGAGPSATLRSQAVQ